MITQSVIKIYNKYGGDIDSFCRGATKKEKLVIRENDFSIIDDIIQDIQLVNKGLASKEFTEKLNTKLKEVTEQDCFELLNKI